MQKNQYNFGRYFILPTLALKNMTLCVDFAKGRIESLVISGRERIASPMPLFCIRLRDKEVRAVLCTSYDAVHCTQTENGAIYSGFSCLDVSVRIYLTDERGEAAWRIAVAPHNDRYFVEWVDFPPVHLPALKENNSSGNGGRILLPYNEGVIISDIDAREEAMPHIEAEYPSLGSYTVFPNMICSQMLAYLWDDAGLYIGAHDARRGVKAIDVIKENNGVTLRLRLFCGTDFGEKFETDYPIVFSVTDGAWESAAERYREWFEKSLPNGAKKILENSALPDWYADSPLVVSYPVRGIHDMDEMKPNKLYPYTNAIPLLDEIRSVCDCRLLVLLMHWEGTAPWAPPYVWPPYGDEKIFNDFLDSLHQRGDLLGVYCSGFGYTVQSNLIADYNKETEYREKELWRGMCAGPDGKVAISKICQGQRSGYDICPASEVGRSILSDAYEPLLKSELDYVQILDQNHGGGQYFCYSREHGHPMGPGAWMTEKMQAMLSDWNSIAGKTLLGCESAAAEPFIANLLFSDNRFELNYMLGTPVPLYAYIYHEYVRNFMGNQVSCPFCTDEDTLRYRMAYSFCAGDCMTLVLTQDGKLMSHWGSRDFSSEPDMNKALRMVANLSRFYKETAKPYLYAGRMIAAPAVFCESITFNKRNSARAVLPSVLSSAWEAKNGDRALILVNPNDKASLCTINRLEISVPPLDAIIIKL